MLNAQLRNLLQGLETLTNGQPNWMATHPHCRQAKKARYANNFNAILLHGAYPRLQYTRSEDRNFSTVHKGQRKLLMSEIGALLLLDHNKEYTVVYAGAAPGIHIPFLAELFPNLTFHLYDPAPFQIEQTARIRLYREYFTDEVARTWVGQPGLVFICDIRRNPQENLVWEDMLAQKRWHEILEPCLTSLKFRLPWPEKGVVVKNSDGDYLVSYLNGDIYLPIWGRHNTTESRLVIRKGEHSGDREYDCLRYEEEMCYFNRRVRPSIHGGPSMVIDGCYDCTAETWLLQQYNQKWGRNILSNQISQAIKQYINENMQTV